MDRHRLYLLLLIAFCYRKSLECGLVFDDISAVRDNRDLKSDAPVLRVFTDDFWGAPLKEERSHKSYRPLTVLTFRLNYLFHGAEPAGYHLVNVVLHFIVTSLYYSLCHHQCRLDRKTSLVSSLSFAAHPIHTEAVTGVVGRAELLSSVFFILAFAAYRETRVGSLVLFVVFSAFATLSKEQGITVLGVAFLYELYGLFTAFRSGRNLGKLGFIKLSISVITGVVLLWTRFKVMGSSLPVFTAYDNPASYEEAPVKQLTWSYLPALNGWLLLCPDRLCCDWTMGAVPLVKTFSDPRNLATLVFVLFTFRWAYRSANYRRRKTLFLGLCLSFLPFLPASNIFFPVGFVVAERVLYLPSMGFCLLIGLGYSELLKSGKKWVELSFYVTLIFHALKCDRRNSDWINEYSLFTSALKTTTANAKIWNNVGHALENDGDFGTALKYFQTAARIQPDDIGAFINVGRIFNGLNDFEAAEAYYLKAKSLLPRAKKGRTYTARIAPHYLSLFLNLGNLISKDPGRLEEAEALYRQAISMRSDYVQAYINLGDVLIKRNKTGEAQEVYERALTHDNENADLYYNLGIVYIERGTPEKALEYFDKALAIDGEHVQALTNSAVLMQEIGLKEYRPEAFRRLFKVLESVPTSERVYFNLGMLGMDDSDYERAEGWFREAVKLKADFRSALFNLALLLNQEKRSAEAVPFLKSLLEHHPYHVKGLILLGDIYTNHLRLLDEAERCYRRILEIDPRHVQGRHNLCVVMVEKGHLAEAEICLQDALRMAPNEAYIARHLQIVQKRKKAKASKP